MILSKLRSIAAPIVTTLVLLAASLMAVGQGCATGGIPPGTIALRIQANVKDASVLIDDKLVGRVSDLSGSVQRMRAGFHRIEIRHPGYYSFFQEIEMKSGEEIIVRAQLRELIQ